MRVSLEIRKGEFMTLLGPSGSGKTTILMMVAGFEKPTEGDIYVNDRSVGYMPPFKRISDGIPELCAFPSYDRFR